LERTILAVRAARLSAHRFGGRDLVTALRRRMRTDGAVGGQVNLTAFAVLALRAAGTAPPARTYAWLERQQNGDGGFSFATAGGSSDIDDTGAVLEALRGHAPKVRARAVRYLRGRQGRDGGFPQQPGGSSNAQSTAWAIQGLLAAGVAPGSLHHRGSPSPLSFLRSLVAGDGHFRYARGVDQTPVWVTGEALMALKGKPLPFAAPPAAAPRQPQATSHGTTSSAGASGNVGATATSSASPTPSAGATGQPGSHRSEHAGATGQGGAAGGAGSRVPSGPGEAAIGRLAAAAGLATALVLAPVGVG
jgi:hypothetical protein